MILHDLRCKTCGFVEPDVACSGGCLPRCPCGGAREVSWEHGKPPATDLISDTHRFNRAFGMEFATTRDAERHAKRNGYEPCADRVHGAEYCPEPKERPRPVARHERHSGPSRSGAARFEDAAA